MRWSPFPADAVRPWRGVVVYAAHGVEQQLKSWTFWLTIFAFMALIVGIAMLAIWDLDRTPLRVAAPVALHEQIEAAADAVEVNIALSETPSTDVSERPQLTIAGEIGGLNVTMMALNGEVSDRLTRDAVHLLSELQIQAFVPEEDVAALDAQRGLGGEEDPAVAMLEVIPVMLGALQMIALITGVGAATRLGRTRDEEYFAVLRMGTPPAVIFIGGLLERMVLSLLMYLPVTVLVLVLLPLLIMGQGLTLGVGRTAVVAALAISGGLSAYFAAACVGAVSGSLSRGAPATAMQGIGTNLLIIVVASSLLQPPRVAGVSAWLMVPGVGATVAAEGLMRGLAPVWVVATVFVHWLWVLIAIRVATWAYALEESPRADLERRFNRLRGAS